MADVIFGINPVREALGSGMEIEKILVSKRSGGIIPLIGAAKKKGIPVVDTDERGLARVCGNDANHQGVCAVACAVSYMDIADLTALAAAAGKEALIVVLDGVEDPQNLGAIARSAEAMGATGMIVPERRTAPISGAAMKASAGALSHIPVARVPNLTSAVRELKNIGLWAVGADMGCPNPEDTDLSGGLILCLGGEDTGLSRILKEECDIMLGIPMPGKTPSLNVSAAGSVLIYEIMRQRRACK